MYQLYRDRPMLVLFMVLANIALSTWSIYADPVINNDGVVYITIAQMFLDGEWQSAFDFFSWPFYSIFIAALAKLLFLDVESAAYLLNTLFVISLTLAFVCIVGELSNNNQRIIFIAVIVILLFPSISKYRAYIIRDFGYLSCYLWSLYFIFRFCSTLQKQHLIGWLLFAAASCLFRFEGIAFLLIAPYFLILFIARRMPHRRKILGSLSLAIITLSLALLYWYINDKYQTMIHISHGTDEEVKNIFELFFLNIKQHFGSDANYLSVFSTNLWNVLYELIRRMAIFYFIFAIYAYLKGLAIDSRLMRRVWLVYVVTNIVVLVGFSLYNSFLVSRYTMATALTLLIFAPFAIDRLWLAVGGANLLKKTLILFVFVLLALASINGLDVRTEKRYIKETGLWMRDNLPADSSVYSNNKLVVYYSGLTPKATLTGLFSNGIMWTYINNGFIRHFDYVAIDTSPKNPLEDAYRQTLSHKFGLPIKVVEGPEGNNMFVFQTKKPE